jgi:hypothetical protein
MSVTLKLMTCWAGPALWCNTTESSASAALPWGELGIVRATCADWASERKKADALRRPFVRVMKRSGGLAAARDAEAGQADAQQGQGGGFGHAVVIRDVGEAARLQEHGGVQCGIAGVGDGQLHVVSA